MKQTRKPNLKADAAYENAILVTTDLIERLRELVYEQPAPGNDDPMAGPVIHWGHVGSINHVNDLLSQAIEHLGGEAR